MQHKYGLTECSQHNHFNEASCSCTGNPEGIQIICSSFCRYLSLNKKLKTCVSAYANFLPKVLEAATAMAPVDEDNAIEELGLIDELLEDNAGVVGSNLQLTITACMQIGLNPAFPDAVRVKGVLLTGWIARSRKKVPNQLNFKCLFNKKYDRIRHSSSKVCWNPLLRRFSSWWAPHHPWKRRKRHFLQLTSSPQLRSSAPPRLWTPWLSLCPLISLFHSWYILNELLVLDTINITI